MRGIALALAAVVAGASAGLWLWSAYGQRTRAAPSVASGAHAPLARNAGCDLSATDGYAFRGHLAIAPGLGEADFVLSAVRGAPGELRARLADATPSGDAGGASQTSSALRELEGRVFGVRVGASCRIESYLVDGAVSAGPREILRGLLLALDVEDREGSHWTVVQRDAIGPFVASYRTLGGARFEKRRLGYVGGVRDQTRVTGATQFTVANGWLGSVSVDERYLAQAGGPDGRFSLELSATGERPAEIGSLPEGQWVRLEAAPRVALDTPAVAAAPHAVDVSQLVSDFVRAKGAAAARAGAELGEAAKTNPSALAQIEALLRSANPEQRASLFLALRIAGTDGAQGGSQRE